MNRAVTLRGLWTVFAATIAVSVSDAQAQTPGRVPIFDPSGTAGWCSGAGVLGVDCVNSVITQDASGNIGIGTTTPAAKLHVVGGDLSLDRSIVKGPFTFLHNSGLSNTFVGVAAGNVTMGGGFNTASGESALRNNNLGSGNTAHGFGALFGNTGGLNNTATGTQALNDNTTGNENTASGFQALFHNTNGLRNTASGYQALFNNTTGCGNTAYGAYALQGTSGTFQLCDAEFLYGSLNTATGFNALTFNNGGSRDTAIGAGALVSNTAGFDNTAVGAGADVSNGGFFNATAIGAGTIVNASNKVRLGNGLVTVVEGPVPYTFTSDRHQKENFRSVESEAVLKKIGALSLTSWNYIGHDPQQFRHYGPVAQDFFAAFGHDAMGTIGTPTTINSGDMEGILMIAVQALERRTAENAELKARIEALERVVAGLHADQR